METAEADDSRGGANQMAFAQRVSGRTVTFVRTHWLALLIAATAIALRVWRFGDIPPGLNIDEVSGAYDAFALLQRGYDRSGLRFPVVFTAFGSGMFPLAFYLSLPLLVTFGVHAWTIRLPALVVNLAAMAAFAALGSKAGGRRMAVLCLLLIATAPWHFLASRWTHELTVFPGFFLCAVSLLAFAGDRESLFPLAMLLFGLCLYTYGPALLVVPVFLTLSLGLLAWRGKLRFPVALRGAAVFAVTALPIAIFVAVNQLQLDSIRLPVLSVPRLTVPHYQTASVLFRPGGVWHAVDNLYILGKLLTTQFDALIWNAVPGYGVLYPWTLPLVALGIGRSLVSPSPRRSPELVLLLFNWLLSGIVLAAIVPANLNRINVLFPALLFFAAIGLESLSRSRPIFWGLVAMYVASFMCFLSSYFTTYPAQIGPYFYASLEEAIDEAADATPALVCVTNTVTFYRLPYIHVLFARRIDPAVFLSTVRFANPGEEFQSVRSFSRYIFGLDNCAAKPIGAYVIDPSELDRFPAAEFFFRPFENYIVVLPRPREAKEVASQ